MKNLKKVLSLVLALAMALSLMTVAFAADAKDYADYDEVTHKEAVDVMTAAGIFDGMGGDFNPDGTLTREQAAKIITYMIMGKDAADKLTTVIAPYSDVSADRWSAGAIAYCTNEGILSGMGNNRFAPTDPVTGLQFGKMLLVALGYDPDIEKLTGDSWAINVSKLAISAGLDENVGVSLSQALTREQAAQMALNTMNADMVDYDNRGTEIDLPGVGSIIVGASNAEAVATTRDKATIANDGYVQFAEQYCEDLSVNGNATSDDFGRPAHTWKYDKTTVGTYADTADATYTTKVKVKDIYSDLGLSENMTASVETNGGNASSQAITKNSTVEIGAQGQLTEVYYDTDADTVKIIHIDTYVGKIAAVHSNVDDPYVTVSTLSAGGPNGEFETTSFDRDDIVLYTYADDEIQSLVLAEKLSGQEVTSFTGAANAATKLTANGTEYTAAAKAKYADNLVADSSYDLYLDTYGNVIYSELYEGGAGNYAYVLECGKRAGIYAGDNEYYAKLLFADGTMQSVQTDKDYSVVYNASSAPNGGGDLEKFIVTYTTNDDEEYVLTAKSAAAAAADTIQLIPGTSLVNLTTGTDFYANSSTIFVVAEKDGNDTTYKAYTGIANAPKIGTSTAGAAVTAIASYGEGTVADYVFIEVNAGVISSDTDEMIFVKGDTKGAGDVVTSGSTTYYAYTAVVNGEETELKVLTSATAAVTALQKNVFLKSVTYNSNGYVTGVTAYTASGDIDVLDETSDGYGTRAESNGTIGFSYNSTKWYTYAEDVAVYVVDGDDVSVGSIYSINDDSNDGYVAIVDSGEVTAIAIVKNGVTTPTITGLSNQTVTLTGSPLQVSATLNPTVGGEYGTTTYKWTATGGTIADDDAKSTNITFDQAGTYTVTLTVRNTISDGSYATTSASATITVNNPTT